MLRLACFLLAFCLLLFVHHRVAGQYFMPEYGRPFGVVYNTNDDFIYGVLSHGSCMFKVKPDGSSMKVFPSHGANSFAFTNNKIYCVSTYGGVYEAGIMFTLDLIGSNYKLIRDFWQNRYREGFPGSFLAASDGHVYGTTMGNVFKIDTSTDTYEIIYTQVQVNEQTTYAPIVSESLIEASSGYLYGLMQGSREYNGPTYFYIYRLKKDGSDFQIIHEFIKENVRGLPAELVELNGKLYGLIQLSAGSAYDREAILYSVSLDGSDYQELYTFQDLMPYHLTHLDGVIYGVGNRIGPYGNLGPQNCQLFKINSDGSGFEIKFTFPADNSQYRVTELIALENGLFGSSFGGTTYRDFILPPFGFLFLYTPGDNNMRYVYDFDNPPVVATIEEQKDNLHAYPNPVKNVFSITNLRSFDAAFIYDNTGKVVSRMLGPFHSDVIDISNLRSGLYRIALEKNGNKTETLTIAKE